MRADNISILKDTLNTFENGYYVLNGKKKTCKLSRQDMLECSVYLPEDVDKIGQKKDFQHVHCMGRMGVGCFNMDSYSLARRINSSPIRKASKPVLVLNLANAVHPGGGVRNGATAQEEDLCRKSSLLISLEGERAQSYYAYNRSLHTKMGSNGIIITPKVEIIKDEKGNYLEDSVIVSVMTCAAPCLSYGMEGLTQEQYKAMLYKRIVGMLEAAAYLGYEYFVLGAFGCGAFDNDPHLVSDMFFKALKKFNFDGMKAKDFFQRVDFAVLDHSANQKNFKEFDRNFNHFYQEEDNQEIERSEKRIKENEVYLDAIRGSLVGGAIGDALGYTIEFEDEYSIFHTYGKEGITEYELKNGKALFSDDTQMTLFTATGILNADTYDCMRGIGGNPIPCVGDAYHDWLFTQENSYKNRNKFPYRSSWLLDVEELYSRRAPGNTCLSALRQKIDYSNCIGNPINSSKGCGGIMRVAPLALYYRNFQNLKELDRAGAEIAAITHGHSLGYMPAAIVTHVLSRILTRKNSMTLKDMVLEAKETAQDIFKGDSHLYELVNIIDLAIELSENNQSDLDNIHQLGEGCVAEETLGIALYCSLKYQNDFSKAIIVSVNHKGDSDSTGAVTGNIVGALNGFSKIEQKWKDPLECYDILLEVADDLCHQCQMDEYSHYYDEKWAMKYINKKKYEKENPYTFFWKIDEKNGEFSNWYPATFVIDDFEYSCVEQYMMAQKAKLFHDSKRYTAILRATTPQEYKALGKLVTPFDPKSWNQKKYEIVKTGNKAKYTQNSNLMKSLLDTKDSILAEASPKDKIWGIGLMAKDAQNIDPEKWPGDNLLGKVLMELREEFQEGTCIKFVLGDITKQKDVDAIVNAANTSLLGGGGVDGAIHRAAGPRLLEECRTLHGCETGEAKITDAYNLDYKKIIHTPGPIYRDGKHGEAELLASCYRNSLSLAIKHNLRKVAFPSISTGVYNFPIDLAASIGINEVLEFSKENPGKLDVVEWVLFDQKTYDVYKETFQKIQVSEFVNSSDFDIINQMLRDGLV